MPTVPGLREQVRAGTAEPFAFELKTTPDSQIRLTVENGMDWCGGVYMSFHALTLEVDPARWLPIFEACAVRCREVVTEPAGSVAGG
jgi:hypothetical protein